MPRPSITPLPPVVPGVAMPWDAAVTDPVASLAGARAAHGDTFVVDSGDDRYLFTFSPMGVESFYALPEEAASKGVADWRMLRRKLPDGIFAGRRMLPAELFGREDVERYLDRLDDALDATIGELGSRGTAEVFSLTRRLGHRVGLASWAAPGAVDGAVFERLVRAFDALDGADAFVHPDAMAEVARTEKAAERAALDEITADLGDLIDRDGAAPLFSRIRERWDAEEESVRRTGTALDVALIHVASMSNLFAALGWSIVDLCEHPAEAQRVAAGDRALAERCALESTRLAQRSIMSRHVLAPVELRTEAVGYQVDPGVTIATMLPLTNTTAAPGLERWRPDRWQGHRLVDPVSLPTPQLVTTFGHGRHTCPARPFSLAAMGRALTTLFGRYKIAAGWDDHPQPVPAQVGGVARAADACRLVYAAR